MRTNIENITEDTQKYQIWAPVSVICSQAGFRNLWGVPPSIDFIPLWGTLGPILSRFWKISGVTLLPISKIPEQQIAPTTPSKNQARIHRKLYL